MLDMKGRLDMARMSRMGVAERVRGRALLACILVAGVASSGCTPLAFALATKEPLDSTTVDVRVTRRQADLSGETCYVERRQRVNSRGHASRLLAGWAAIEALAGLLMVIDGQVGGRDLEMIVGLPFILDGGIAALYVFTHDGKVITDESWVPTDETATCAR
jgi:hypothetical protein